MAELVVPMAVLGGMYIISNQKNKKEEFTANRNLQENRHRKLTNINSIPKNFPQHGVSSAKNEVGYYPSPNVATDRYFQESVYQAKAENDSNDFSSLTGNKVNTSELKHNNMVPFYGSRVKHNLDHGVNEMLLDRSAGAGSQHFRKQEQAPLFKPEENVQWAHGTPNTSSFVQSRMNPSMSMNNVKPFQEVRVGPGLNDKGGVLGSGGFNAGMEARDTWRPKTVDELRAKTNPKVSYEGVILGGKDRVTNLGIMGKMEKHLPETYYVNTPERYFTTTGVEKGPTVRSQHVMPSENRETTTREYFGTNGNSGLPEAPYVSGTFMESKRPILDSNINHISNMHAKNKYKPTEGDYGVDGFKKSITMNNRTLDSQISKPYGSVSTLVHAIVAPIMDILRPTRKDNVIGNIRPVGNAGRYDVQAGYVNNPADRARTTIREMTEKRREHNFINNQQMTGVGGYKVQNTIPVDQQRDTTSIHYIGNKNNSIEQSGYGYAVTEVQPTDQNRDTTSIQYNGNAGIAGGVEGAQIYDYAYNAHLIDKEPLSRGRTPMGDNVKVYNGQNFVNVQTNKIQSDRNNNRMFVPQQVSTINAHVQQYGQSSTRSEIGQNIHMQRNTSHMIESLKNNPYAKSFHSIA